MPGAIHQNSSHFAPISFDDLSPAQAQVVAALAQGQTVTAAAQLAGVHRTTIHTWVRTVPDFKAAVEIAQNEHAAALNDGIRELAARALHTLHDLLQDPTTPPAVRLRTALAVLQRHQDLLLPETVPEVIAGDPEAAAPAPAPAPAVQIARGGPCPCGSGLKFKRCCGVGARPLTPHARAA